MKTRFLCVKTAGKEEKITIQFIFWILISWFLILAWFDSPFKMGAGFIISFVFGWVTMTGDRVNSARKRDYMLRYRDLSPNFKDKKYFGNKLFELPNYKKIIGKGEMDLEEEDSNQF